MLEIEIDKMPYHSTGGKPGASIDAYSSKAAVYTTHIVIRNFEFILLG